MLSVKEGKELIKNLSAEEKENYYFALRFEYVKEDLISQIDESFSLSDKDKEKVAEKAAERYLYQGDYYGEVPYYDQLNDLIYEVMEDLGISEKEDEFDKE